jgi:CDP-diacylglycerol--glycerol-3-phosphate 3-phosphatidyltransferase
MTWPNRITLARILLVAPYVFALLKLQDPRWGEQARYFALAVFTLMALSDALDGYLARRLKQSTPLGRFLDPCADMLLITCSVIALAHEGTHVRGAQLPAAVAVIVLGKIIIQIIGVAIVFFETTRVLVDPQMLGKTCTALLLLMVVAVLASPDFPSWLRWLPAALWWMGSVLSVAVVVQYFQMAQRFVHRHMEQHKPQG